MPADSTKLFIEEQELLKSYREEQPDVLVAKRNFTPEQILERIGITHDFGPLPQGYMSLYHQDFIVEEVGLDGQVRTIEPESSAPPTPDPAAKTLFCDVVKVGLSTVEARDNIAGTLGLEQNQISYAGIKDKFAITSQRLAVRGVDPATLQAAQIPGLFLKNFELGKGVMEKGQLKGNRFSILIRTPFTFGQGWVDTTLETFKQGFYNFYYLQRFGTPRLLSAELGKLILQQDYESCVQMFLFSMGTHDVPLIAELRKEGKRNFGNWPLVHNLFSKLPYTFRLELQLLEHLLDRPSDFKGALRTIEDQTTLWVYAYSSWLFNRHLSQLIAKGEGLPEELPLLLNPAAKDIPLYQEFLIDDGIGDPEPALIALFGRSLVNPKNTAPTKIHVDIHQAVPIEKAVALSFTLPAAAYATTFLAHMFSLVRGKPVPDWLDTTKHDVKKILGLGSVAEAEAVLGPYIFSQVEGE